MPDPMPFAHFAPPIREQSPLRRAITAAHRRPEAECLAPLLASASLPQATRLAVRGTARTLVTALRAKRRPSGIDALVQEYALSSDEGIALMCLAEALLRIPDIETRDALIRDKIGGGDWHSHLGDGRSLFVNAATWGLVATGRLVGSVRGTADNTGLGDALTRVVARAGEPVIRRAVDLAMGMMGEQFVTGESISKALKRARQQEAKGFSYSYDMLGEAAMTAADAARYYLDYKNAILAIGKAAAGRGICQGPGISIKLSALHPRYERSQADRVAGELLPRVKELAKLARRFDIGFNIDAEEAARLELSLDILESLAIDPDLAGWDGLGFVVQSYGKRCPQIIDWLIDLALRSERRIMVRLVKGAYWDAEIKQAQVDGLADFPVFTRKVHTDISYISCARKLLGARGAVFPQFATHNAQTLATIHHLAGPDFTPGDWEFQCLHGMGEPLYAEVVGPGKLDRPCRIYAPVGSHERLLAYLVRRLLENGANSSFVNRIGDPTVSVAELVADPAEVVRASGEPGAGHPAIALPARIYGERQNSAGIDLSDEAALEGLSKALVASSQVAWDARPLIPGRRMQRQAHPIRNPADDRDIVGTRAFSLERDAVHAARTAAGAAPAWAATQVAERAAMLDRAADAMQEEMPVLLGLVVREAGKSVPNAISEVREAIDFLRYYADQARQHCAPGVRPLGPVVCISPWNFPLAIFAGQVAAALAAGNTVLAKPAEETPLIAAQGVRILHAAGVPAEVLQFLPGDGAIGAALVAAPETAGVMFTGSTAVAKSIQAQLASRLSAHGEPIPLVAETGGQNAMIVDSSALPEQVVSDVMASAFDSAGQRCSALRLLCLQEEIADRTLAMLRGALAELRLGPTDRLCVDVGPVITREAQENIERHVQAMRARGFAVDRALPGRDTANGTFVAPTIIEIEAISDLDREVFGPVLHVIRYDRAGLDALIDAINATGFGLTFGLHTRLDETVTHVTGRVMAGNLYVNRNVIGAVVGAQPFGGRGLSGTGPKAGGPLYLRRLVRHPVPRAIAGHAPVDPALSDFARWLDNRGDAEFARLAEQLGAASPPRIDSELPGPVGERNLYGLRPCGTVLLRPLTRNGMVHQIAASLATGNDFAVEAKAELRSILSELPRAVRQRLRDPAETAAAALVEGEGSRVTDILAELSARAGGIAVAQAAPSTRMLDSGAYDAQWLVREVATSIDTTASGGNARLLML